MLDPFRNPATVCVNGYTYLFYDDFFTRTFALIWFFPMARGDEKFAAKRAINANNVAFRGDWITSHPFPPNNGFKVSCTLLMHQLRREGHEIVHAGARVYHYPPRGWRFFCWRALVTGRDADRKYTELHSPNRALACGQIIHTLGNNVVAHYPTCDEPRVRNRHAAVADPVCNDGRHWLSTRWRFSAISASRPASFATGPK
ncbi:hypothetical protein ACVOMV_02985 [Mesorhizobium atlanticum]